MSGGQGAKLISAQMAEYQPASFEFTPENLEEAAKIIAKYPAGKQQSALMPLLTLAQQQHYNWLPVAAMDYVAAMLGIPPMRAYEVATFYTMYNLKPVGKYFIEVCTTTPCWLRGSDGIVQACRDELGVEVGETTQDGKFTLVEVECLCACANAPMIQIGQHYYEDLTPDSMRSIIRNLRFDRPVQPGPQSGRKCSEPAGGLTSLTTRFAEAHASEPAQAPDLFKEEVMEEKPKRKTTRKPKSTDE